jgi:hypothetical protein
MKKFLFTISFLVLGAFPELGCAHGFVSDGHEQALTIIDYLELGGIIAASIGLMAFSYFGSRKEKK